MCCAHVRTHWELLLWLVDPGHLTMFDPHFGYASVGHLAQSHALTCHETAKPRGVCPASVPSSAVQGIVGQAANETSKDKRMGSVRRHSHGGVYSSRHASCMVCMPSAPHTSAPYTCLCAQEQRQHGSIRRIYSATPSTVVHLSMSSRMRSSHRLGHTAVASTCRLCQYHDFPWCPESW